MRDGQLEIRITEALRASAKNVEQTRPWRWRVGLANGRPMAVDVRADERWVSLSTQAGGVPNDTLELLRHNEGLGGSSRIALSLDTWSLGLRSDVLLCEGVPLAERINEACAGLKLASERLTHGCGGSHAALGTRALEDEAVRNQGLADSCRDAGWSVIERDSGALAIELDVDNACHRAMLEPVGGGGVRVSAEAASIDAESLLVREAVGALLLSSCHTLRFARAAVTGRETLTARFEVAFAEPPAPGELDEGLHALAAACRLYAREIDVLQDEAIAVRFLELTGSCRRNGPYDRWRETGKDGQP
ncbi:MAG: hypothetical protein ACT4QD_11460 [Acidobacteriota bacterium]